MERMSRNRLFFAVFFLPVLCLWLGGGPAFAGLFENIRHISGGVGVEEREAMEESAGAYNLHLVFSKTPGSYVANVRVIIRDADGNEVLSAVSDGPWFLVKLPEGKYEVISVYREVTRSKTVSVTNKINKINKVHFFRDRQILSGGSGFETSSVRGAAFRLGASGFDVPLPYVACRETSVPVRDAAARTSDG
jgi:hypothetical protein